MSSPSRFFLTGCASGIGRHLADVLVAQGHHVFATDLDEPAMRAHADELASRRSAPESHAATSGEQGAEQGASGAERHEVEGWPAHRVFIRQLDVRDDLAWARVFSEAVRTMGAVDILINVAGYLLPGYVGDFDAAAVHRHLDVNTKGVIFGTHTAARHMVERGQGHIVNIASLAALAPVPGISLYSASKYAVRAFSLAAATELRPRGVAVSVVCPDAVQTPMLDMQVGYREAALTFSGARVLTVHDVVDAVVRRVLPRRPLELHLPRSRALLARLADLFPGTGMWLAPLLDRKGRARQRVLQNERARKP